MKKIVVLLAISLLAGTIFNKSYSKEQLDKSDVLRPIVTICLSNKQTIKIELYPEEAPNTVNNFIDLVERKFYDGLTLKEAVPQYLWQTGDQIGNGTGFPGYFIKSECKANGFDNTLPFTAGVVGMARAHKYNTEGSQFFILLTEDKALDGKYTAFGKVIQGLAYLQQQDERPLKVLETPLVIQSVTVETFGIDYREPEVLSMNEVRSIN